MNIYEYIKAMGIEQLAEFIENTLEFGGGCIKSHHKCRYVITCGSCVNASECIKEWLESEIRSNNNAE